MGQHVGGNRAPKNITLHHNLYANLGSRTPLLQHADVFDFRNNVIYNWSGNNASVFGQYALNSSAFGSVSVGFYSRFFPSPWWPQRIPKQPTRSTRGRMTSCMPWCNSRMERFW